MLFLFVGLVACVLCVLCCFLLMKSGRRGVDAELTSMRAAVAAEVRGKTVNEAIALLNATRPTVRTVMVAPGSEYEGPAGGYVVVFHADSGADTVRSFDIGRNGNFIDHTF